jgi:hypothetical protein
VPRTTLCASVVFGSVFQGTGTGGLVSTSYAIEHTAHARVFYGSWERQKCSPKLTSDNSSHQIRTDPKSKDLTAFLAIHGQFNSR